MSRHGIGGKPPRRTLNKYHNLTAICLRMCGNNRSQKSFYRYRSTPQKIVTIVFYIHNLTCKLESCNLALKISHRYHRLEFLQFHLQCVHIHICILKFLGHRVFWQAALLQKPQFYSIFAEDRLQTILKVTALTFFFRLLVCIFKGKELRKQLNYQDFLNRNLEGLQFCLNLIYHTIDVHI